jgi:hypothetical protein
MHLTLRKPRRKMRTFGAVNRSEIENTESHRVEIATGIAKGIIRVTEIVERRFAMPIMNDVDGGTAI